MPSKKPQHLRSLTLCCAIATLVVIAFLLLRDRGLLTNSYETVEYTGKNWVMKLARSAEVDPRLVFLAIDYPSLSLENARDEIPEVPALQLMAQEWPWPRQVYAPIIERLAEAGASVIALDLLFPTPRDGDETFRAALEKYRDRVVIGSTFVEEEDGMSLTYAAPSETLIPQGSSGEAPDGRVGFVNYWTDLDGVVRQARFRRSILEAYGARDTTGMHAYESFAAKAVRNAGYADRVPQDFESRIIRFIRPTDIRPRSLYEIFAPQLWEHNYGNGEFFRDKIVIIGPEGNWSKDVIRSPWDLIPGPMYHLNAANALLKGEFLTQTPFWVDLLLVGCGGLVAWALGYGVRHPGLRAFLLLACAAAWFGSAILLYNLGLVVLVSSPIIALAASGTSFSVLEQLLDRRERARIRSKFERYVSKDVVMEVLDNPQSFLNSLGGERRPVTILFSDVRGFTTATESAEPGALVKQLNEYFHEMVRIVRVETRGTLDKFIGDAVMAHWGSIVTCGPKEDACSAVSAALKMREELNRLNEEWAKKGQLHFAIGIGINHGEVVVGNIGSEERAEVSVIGDAVNLASRLEGVTKPYHVDICLGESVAEFVRDTFVLRSLDLIVVKGKTKPVEVFTVLERRSPATLEPAWLSAHEEAMRLYRRGEFADAIRCWREVLAQNPGDSVAELFIERCETLLETPPAQPWTGVWEMKSK